MSWFDSLKNWNRNNSKKEIDPNPTGTSILFGPNSERADLEKLALAKKLYQTGMGRDDLWASSGWGKDTRGNWWYEQETGPLSKRFTEDKVRTGRFADAWKNWYALRNYGGRLVNVLTSKTTDKNAYSTSGYYNPSPTGYISVKATPNDPLSKSLRKTIAHEGFHRVEGLEGVHSYHALNDSNLDKKKYKHALKNDSDIQKAYDNLAKYFKNYFKERGDNLSQGQIDLVTRKHLPYHMNPSEALAFSLANRSYLTRDEKKKKHFLSTAIMPTNVIGRDKEFMLKPTKQPSNQYGYTRGPRRVGLPLVPKGI